MQLPPGPPEPAPPPLPPGAELPPVRDHRQPSGDRPRARGTRASAVPRSQLPLVGTSWVVFLIAFLLVLQYVIPYLLERYQYAVTRGRQQAEYDMATASLKDMPLEALSKAYQMVSQHVGPSVVHINVVSVRQQELPREFAQLFGPQRRELRGQGSGVIVDAEGFVVTNYHVVLGARDIRVSLSDGRVLPARVVGTDALTDLAVLKIDADGLVAAPWGDSEDLQVGAMVWAIGSPFGLQRTITFGILSAKHRAGMAGEVYQDFLQTDAAVNPGNSGGPLVDAQGRVVGINTAILGESYQGVSFAIPSSIARQVYERLKVAGSVRRGWLGVQLREVEEEDILRYGLPDTHGALVSTVIDETDIPCPARDAGMRAGDVVVSWNGRPITKPAELIRWVAMTDVGQEATAIVLRDGRRISLTIVVAQRPAVLDS